jgi:ankyrin repeat protein
VKIENEKNNKNMSENSGKEPDLRLHDAVCEGIDEVQELLEENVDLLFEVDDEGRTPLHTLCISGKETCTLWCDHLS